MVIKAVSLQTGVLQPIQSTSNIGGFRVPQCYMLLSKPGHPSAVYLIYVCGKEIFWRQDIHHNDIKHSDIHHNDIKHSDIQHNDIKHSDIQHNEIQHNDIQHSDIQHNTMSIATFSIITLIITTLTMKCIFETPSTNGILPENTFYRVPLGKVLVNLLLCRMSLC